MEALNTYEGMFIFLDALKDEELEAAVKELREEIEKLGGTIDNTARMGRRPFARLQGKRHKAGNYVIMNFSLEPARVKSLLARLQMKKEVFRTQIIAQDESTVPADAEAEPATAEG